MTGQQFPTGSLLALEKCVPTAVQHNQDWENIVTPLRAEVWEKLLVNHPDRDFAGFVVRGIRHGFRIGYDYTSGKCRKSRGNLRSAAEHGEVVQCYIEKELAKGRLIGPLSTEATQRVHVNPFGVIPKKEPGQWRLIVDLSAPRGGSVNDGIRRECCTLSYLSVDDIVERILLLGPGAQLAKFDLKAAYRNIPVHPDDRHLLGLRWGNDTFVDTVLPFGLRSAPILFSAVAEALAYIIHQKGSVWMDHYLDDFVVVGPPGSYGCAQTLQIALETCKEVGFPVAGEKTEGPTTVLTVLGIEIDSNKMELRLPESRLSKLLEVVGSWRKRKCATKRQLQSLAGHLNHACKVVSPGRKFLRGIFSLLSSFNRQNHKIRLNAAFRADLEWWWVFVSTWNGVSMMLTSSPESPGVEFWSDASGSWGCGAVWGPNWFQVEWSQWPEFGEASIAAKELLPILVAMALWGRAWRGQVVLCHCDNQAVVAAIKGGYCKDTVMAHMLRCLFYVEARWNTKLMAKHIPGIQNVAADSVSRNNLDRLFSSFPQANRTPLPVPGGLVEHLVFQTAWTPADWKKWLDSWWITP